jgi:hypothetical protein
MSNKGPRSGKPIAPALDPAPVIPSDLSFGYLSAELKSPVKIPIPSHRIDIGPALPGRMHMCIQVSGRQARSLGALLTQNQTADRISRSERAKNRVVADAEAVTMFVKRNDRPRRTRVRVFVEDHWGFLGLNFASK